jgi:hypothetical protein
LDFTRATETSYILTLQKSIFRKTTPPALLCFQRVWWCIGFEIQQALFLEIWLNKEILIQPNHDFFCGFG